MEALKLLKEVWSYLEREDREPAVFYKAKLGPNNLIEQRETCYSSTTVGAYCHRDEEGNLMGPEAHRFLLAEKVKKFIDEEEANAK